MIDPLSNQELTEMLLRTKRLLGEEGYRLDVTKTDSIAHQADTMNPHSVTKSQVGLDSVENLTATQIRQATDRGLQVEVRSSYPAHAQGKVIFHTGEGKFKGSTGTEWL